MSVDFLQDSQFRVYDPDRDVSRALQLYHRAMEKARGDKSLSQLPMEVKESILDLQKAHLSIVAMEGAVLRMLGESPEK